jgi:hypothetical protein
VLRRSLADHPNFELLGVRKEDLKDLGSPAAGGLLMEYLRRTQRRVSCACSFEGRWFVHCDSSYAIVGDTIGEACAKVLLQIWELPVPVPWVLQPIFGEKDV